MAYNWDEYKNSGDFVSFKEVGDHVIGIIKMIRTGTDFNDKPCPELIIEDAQGDERTVTASQVMLKAALAEKAPQIGDRIRIVYSGIGDAKPGKAPAKQFTVDITTDLQKKQAETKAAKDTKRDTTDFGQDEAPF